MKLLRNSAVAFLLWLLSSITTDARIEDGMLFRSYDVPVEKRTSLILPGEQNEWIIFSDSLTVSFSIKIELNKGRFGYICRMALDDQMPVDFLLSPHGNSPAICATADHLNIVLLNDEGDDIREWKDFYVRIHESGDNLIMTANSREVFRTAYTTKRHRIKMYFGKVDASGLSSSDVAPMVLADLQLRVDGKRTVSWPLSAETDLVKHHGISIKAHNALFMKDFNRRWTNVFTAEVPSVSYACFSEDKSIIWYVSDGQVIMYDVGSATPTSLKYGMDMKMNLVCGEFEVLPDGTLVYADVERGQFIRFDRDKSEWMAANGRTRTSIYLHHNSVYLEDRGEFVQMSGYGQHCYSCKAFIWDPSDLSVCSEDLCESGVSAETIVRAADCRLLFDSLDENAVLQKCRALISLGKTGTANSVFTRFTAEYKRVMSEEFEMDFTDFIKKAVH